MQVLAAYKGLPSPAKEAANGTTTGRRYTSGSPMGMLEKPKLSTLGVMVTYVPAEPVKMEKLW